MRARLELIIPLVLPLLLLALGLHLIGLADFLFWWDERFHALVAKNLLADPSITRLYPKDLEAILGPDKDWYKDPIWLHKPPLFSYLQALSMQLFGSSIIAMRFPSVMALLAIYFSLWQILKLKDWPTIEASLLAFGVVINPFLLKLMMGWQGMDHNDLAFIAFISLSLWALIRYQHKPSTIGLLLISLFVAMAVLSKWLPGLLAFLFWGLVLSFQKEIKLKPIITAALLSLLLIIPWYIYTYQLYPDRWLEAMLFNSRHFTEVIENHSGPWYFHVEQWFRHFFLLIAFSIGLWLLGLKKSNGPKPHARAAWLSLAFVLLFYSIAATKLPAFSFIGLGLLVIAISPYRPQGKIARWLSSLFVLLAVAQMAWIPFVNFDERYPVNIHRAQFYRELDEQLDGRAIILGALNMSHVEAQFYCRHLILEEAIDAETRRKLETLPYPVYELEYDSSGLELGLKPIRLDRQ
jgi:4-amino-4-deoxy-L-arabinose transferase